MLPTITETVGGLNLMTEFLSSSSEHEANAMANTAQTIEVVNFKKLTGFILILFF